MHCEARVVLVVPALDEQGSIASVVRSFRAHPAVDLVLVVDNGSRDRTAEEARAAGAVVFPESRRGYGAALRAGIEQALELGAGIVVLSEADGTFDPADLGRLLALLEHCDLVLGSRTHEMRGALRLGNRLVARILGALWPGRCRLTDVGCTYRVFTAAAWDRMRDGTRVDGPEFSPRMIGAALRAGLGVHEVPVRYHPRSAGESKHTGTLAGTAVTASRMLRTILAQRLSRH